MRTAFLFTLSLIAFNSSAQDTATSVNPNLSYKHAVKLYGSGTYNYNPSTGKSYFDLNLNPTFQWINKHFNTEEIGLDQLSGAFGNENRWFSIALRYEYKFNLFGAKWKNWRWVPFAGVGVTPYMDYSSYRPLLSNNFPNTSVSIGVRTFVDPGVTFYFSKRFFATISAPISLMSVGFTHRNIKDPDLMPNAQRYSLADFDIGFRGSGLRLGIGLKF